VFVGDSQSRNLATGLAIWGAQHDVDAYDLAQGGCTIGRGGERRLVTGELRRIPAICSWWGDPNGYGWQAVREIAPDLIVVLSGVYDSFDRKLAEWPAWRTPTADANDEFRTWTRSQFVTAYRTFAGSGARVAAVTAPCDNWIQHTDWQTVAEGDRRIDVVNRDVIIPAAAEAGVPLLDLNAVLCPGGRFASASLGVADARPDGFHLTDAAAAVLATRWLGPEITKLTASPLPAPLPVPG
jgi:lysophospholipase L1-like esterase